MTEKKHILLTIRLMLIILLAACVILGAAMYLGNRLLFQTAEEEQPANEDKTSDMYTWEEYQALSLEEQDVFFQRFDSTEEFETWMEAVKPDEGTAPILIWDKPGKLPDAYTWEEYQNLSQEERDAFFNWFDSEETFEAWMESAKLAESTETDMKWDESEKLPSAYTWEEYQALTPEKKEAFYHWFESVDAFEAWMDAVKPEENTTPDNNWDKLGKRPDEYTWLEYQALSLEDKEAFYQWFDSVEAFETWMNAAQNQESELEKSVWDKLGKRPDEYTWEEYQMLSPEEQDAFYLWFGSVQAFEAWMDAVKPHEDKPGNMAWDEYGKLPDEYTWEEYEALSPEAQELFYQWFGSVEAFEAWMQRVKPDVVEDQGPVWSKPGKLPDQYTKEEYLALTPEEKDAFFLWFNTLEEFEAWVEKAETP